MSSPAVVGAVSVPVIPAVRDPSTPSVSLRFCDNRVKWSRERIIEVPITASATPKIMRMQSLGSYRTRQWEIVLEAVNSVIVTQAEETLGGGE
jgi:hypothetical protein